MGNIHLDLLMFCVPQEATVRLQWGHQISMAMAYLSNRGYIHRDLACRNVLIKASHAYSKFKMACNSWIRDVCCYRIPALLVLGAKHVSIRPKL